MLIYLYFISLFFLLIIFLKLLININHKFQKAKYIFTSYANVIYRVKAKKFINIRSIHTFNNTHKKAIDKYEAMKDITYFITDIIDKNYVYVTITHKGIYSLLLNESQKRKPKIKILVSKSRKSNFLESYVYQKSFADIRSKEVAISAKVDGMFDETHFICFKIL